MEGTLTITFCYPSNIVINSGQYNLVSFALGWFFCFSFFFFSSEGIGIHYLTEKNKNFHRISF